MLGTKAPWGKAGNGAVVLVISLVPALILNLVVLLPRYSTCRTMQWALIAKIMCYAICALAMDLIWGYTGILSLGHGLFFALGGYAMGMYLMRQIGRDGSYQATFPTSWFSGLEDGALALDPVDQFHRPDAAGGVVPGLLAFVFGFFAFRSRIKGFISPSSPRR